VTEDAHTKGDRKKLGRRPKVPNIFKYATTELSQDAVICWLVACAKDAEEPYRKRGTEFVHRLWAHGCATNGDRSCCITNITEPQRQYQKVDVYFQARVNADLVSFVIEDKIDTKMHGNQLARYRDEIRGDNRHEGAVCLIYYKIGYVFDDERRQAKEEGYAVFGAEDMLAFLNTAPVQDDHEILRQYRDHLTSLIDERNTRLKNWNMAYDFVQYEFMSRLRDWLVKHKDSWAGCLTGEMRPADGQDSVGRGKNLNGGPWTQYWFCKYLFWRLDNHRLRLMVSTKEASEVVGWDEKVWHQWIETFSSLQDDIGAPVAKFQRQMYRDDGFVAEGTVGAIDLRAAPSVSANDLEATLEKIVQLHCEFIRQISTNA